MGMTHRFILASASPARLSVLRQAGLSPEVVVSQVDEAQATQLDPNALTSFLARLKAEKVWAGLAPGESETAGLAPAKSETAGDAATTTTTIVVGCDSVLAFQGQALGKPGSPAAVLALWRRIRGRTAALVTGHHVIVSDRQGDRRTNRVARTVVHFADLSDEEIMAYADTGEPERMAGGFTIDGRGGPFVTRLEGDPHNVIGLSLPLLRMMLADLGVRWTDLWTKF